MAGRLRSQSGREVIAALSRFGFTILSQRGTHAKLRRLGPRGEKQTLLIPVHDELDRGTLRAIFQQASRYIAEDELRPYFYSE